MICTLFKTTVYKNSGRSAAHAPPFRHSRRICGRNTEDFIRELAKVHWHFSRADANEWIERYQPDFADKTTDLSENRLWILRNMGRVH